MLTLSKRVVIVCENEDRLQGEGMKTRYRTSLTAIPFILLGITAALAQQGWVATRIAAANQDLNTVYFLDSKRGWIGGDNGFLSRTDDGGTTWVNQAVGTTDAINDIYFRDKERGFLLAGNTIFATQDSGARWAEVRRFLPDEVKGAAVELYSVRFSSKKKGWVVGSVSKADHVIDSILAITENGGETWQRQRLPSSSELIHIDFVNDRRGWIVGTGGTILNTTDSGENWSKQTSGVPATLYHVDFRNEKKGLAVGERGAILLTGDGGESWTPIVVTGVRSTLLSVEFVSEDEAWAVGRGGTILRTGDGGSTWAQQESTVKQNLYALQFSKKVGWVVGGGGMILRYER
ncbi:MAG: YCF48-related protein [Acidobacteriota bacterium]